MYYSISQLKEATHYHEQFGPMDKRSAVKGFVVCKIWDYNALKPVHRHNLIIDLLCLLKEMLIESIKSNNRLFCSTGNGAGAVSREDMYSKFQPWVLNTYGDSAKTKTITRRKALR